MGERTADVTDGDIGETLAYLADVIAERRRADPAESYTARLLAGGEDTCLSKVIEEAAEVVMACKDADHDHIRYEMGDLLYHLLVVAERFDITLAELAGELDARRQ